MTTTGVITLHTKRTGICDTMVRLRVGGNSMPDPTFTLTPDGERIAAALREKWVTA